MSPAQRSCLEKQRKATSFKSQRVSLCLVVGNYQQSFLTGTTMPSINAINTASNNNHFNSCPLLASLQLS